jgi:DDE superfamily endonuclease
MNMSRQLENHKIMKGCIGALDSWLCKIETPSANHMANSQLFHNGHYNAEGVYIQVCCDFKCQLIHVSINSSGSTNNIVAYSESYLSQLVEKLTDGKYIVGDRFI